MIKKSILATALFVGATNLVNASYCDYADGLRTTISPPPERKHKPIQYRQADIIPENFKTTAEATKRLDLIIEILQTEDNSSGKTVDDIQTVTGVQRHCLCIKIPKKANPQLLQLYERLVAMSLPELIQFRHQRDMARNADNQSKEATNLAEPMMSLDAYVFKQKETGFEADLAAGLDRMMKVNLAEFETDSQARLEKIRNDLSLFIIPHQPLFQFDIDLLRDQHNNK